MVQGQEVFSAVGSGHAADEPLADKSRNRKLTNHYASSGLRLGALGGDAAEAEVFDFDEFVDAVFGAFAAEAGFWMLVLPASQMGSGQAQFVMGAVALA